MTVLYHKSSEHYSLLMQIPPSLLRSLALLPLTKSDRVILITVICAIILKHPRRGGKGDFSSPPARAFAALLSVSYCRRAHCSQKSKLNGSSII